MEYPHVVHGLFLDSSANHCNVQWSHDSPDRTSVSKRQLMKETKARERVSSSDIDKESWIIGSALDQPFTAILPLPHDFMVLLVISTPAWKRLRQSTSQCCYIKALEFVWVTCGVLLSSLVILYTLLMFLLHVFYT